MKRFLLVMAIILWVACVSFIFFGIFHISQTIGDISTPVKERNCITYIALFIEIGFGIGFGVLGTLCYIKHRNYEY